MSIRGKFLNSQDDLDIVLGAALHFQYPPALRVSFVLAFLVTPIGLMVIWFNLGVNRYITTWGEPYLGCYASYLSLLAGVAVAHGVFKAYFSWVFPRLRPHCLRKRRPPTTVDFTLEDGRLSLRSEGGEVLFPLSGVEQMFVTRTAVGFLVGPMLCHVPRQAFALPSDFDHFVQSAFKSLSEEARLKSQDHQDIQRCLRAAI